MIKSEELAQLMQQAFADKTAEPAFFLALLDASVYAHVPRDARQARVRFIQFTTPEGLTVLPFFSDEMQARVAAGSTVSVVAMSGRELFALTRGATLMLNPNESSCLLYPEEVSALLDHSHLAILDRVDTSEQSLQVEPASVNPTDLIQRLVALFANLGLVQSAYLCEISAANETDDRRLLIAAAVSPKHVERVARATTAEIQVHCAKFDMIVDFTAFDPGSLPDWLKEMTIQPFYLRSVKSSGLH